MKNIRISIHSAEATLKQCTKISHKSQKKKTCSLLNNVRSQKIVIMYKVKVLDRWAECITELFVDHIK